MKVYHNVFGTYSPYCDLIDAVVGKSPPLYCNKETGVGVKTKDSPVIKRIYLELEDIYTGCTKLMHVWRQEFINGDELRTKKRKKTLNLNIPPGVKSGTQFCFMEEGDRFPSKIPSDIIFVVEDKPHPKFKRINQHDIEHIMEIDLSQSLTGLHFTICTLDQRQLRISITDVVHPGYKKVIPSEGLPKFESVGISNVVENTEFTTRQYGDLVVKFRGKI